MPSDVQALGAAQQARDLSPLALSALFSNLRKGSEKQTLLEEAALYAQLEAYYAARAMAPETADWSELAAAIDADLDSGIPAANAAAGGVRDRGALRSLVWDEKVTRIQKSLVKKAQQAGPEATEAANYYVCTACAFIFQGEAPPDLCPVCKVPAWKFDKA